MRPTLILLPNVTDQVLFGPAGAYELLVELAAINLDQAREFARLRVRTLSCTC